MIIQILELGPESAFYEDRNYLEGGVFETTKESIVRKNYLSDLVPLKFPTNFKWHIKSFHFYDVKWKILFR